jgi:hypothetical protein
MAVAVPTVAAAEDVVTGGVDVLDDVGADPAPWLHDETRTTVATAIVVPSLSPRTIHCYPAPNPRRSGPVFASGVTVLLSPAMGY